MFESVEEVRNDSPLPLDVHLEPWGAVHALATGKTLRIIVRSPLRGTLEVVHGAKRVTIHAWPGATAQAFEGTKLVEDCRPAVPDVLTGISIRRFIKLMFGS